MERPASNIKLIRSRDDPQLLQHLSGRCVSRMLFEQFKQYGVSFLRRAFNGIDARQIHVSLIESGSDPNAFFKTSHGFISALRAQIKNPQVVERFGIDGPELQRFLQKFKRVLRVIILRKNHSNSVVRLRIIRIDG